MQSNRIKLKLVDRDAVPLDNLLPSALLHLSWGCVMQAAVPSPPRQYNCINDDTAANSAIASSAPRIGNSHGQKPSPICSSGGLWIPTSDLKGYDLRKDGAPQPRHCDDELLHHCTGLSVSLEVRRRPQWGSRSPCPCGGGGSNLGTERSLSGLWIGGHSRPPNKGVYAGRRLHGR